MGGTDLNTVWTRQDGVVAVAPVIDFGDRDLLAIGVSQSQEAEIVLAPLRTALRDAFGTPEGVPDGIEMRMDNGPQYRGSVCRDLCEDWHLEQSFTPVATPTGNAITERVDPDHEDGADLGQGLGERTGTPRGPGGVAPHLQPPAAA